MATQLIPTAAGAPAIRIANDELEAWEARRAESDLQIGALETQVDQIAKATADAIADTRSFIAVPSAEGEESRRDASDNIILRQVGGSEARICIVAVAHDQIAQKLDIPKQYYQRMLAAQQPLLCENINTWLAAEPKSQLLRMLRPYDEAMRERQARLEAAFTLRAFLSASFRPLDNAQLVQTILPIARDAGALLKEFSLTDQRLHAKFITRHRDVNEIRREVFAKHGMEYHEGDRVHVTVNGKDIAWVNEIVAMGFYIRNSETGFASLDVAGVLEVMKCLNAFIGQNQCNVRHVGRKQNAEEEIRYLSAQTQRLDNAAIFSRVRDTVLASLDEIKQVESVEKLMVAKSEPLALPMPTFEFVGNIATSFNLNEAESEILREEVVRSQMQEGKMSRFVIAQGMTALARETKDYDRRTELERAGWQMIDQDTSKLLAAGRAATKKKN